MVDLAFAPQHNMIAYLEKTKNNAKFHHIVDFFTSSSIHHSLTGEGSGSGPKHQEAIGGAMAQLRSEGALIQSIDPPLSTGYTVGSREDRMEHESKLTDLIPQTPYDSPLSVGHTPGSNEGSMILKELMDLCTTLLQNVLDLENVKTAQAKEISSLKKKRHSLGRRKVSKQGRKNLNSQQMFKDIDDVLDEDANTEMIVEDKGNGEKGGSTAETVSTARPDISVARPEEKRIAFKDADDSARPIRSITTLQPLPTNDPKDKVKGILQEPEPVKKTKKKDQDQIERDAEVGLKIQAHLDEEARTDRERQEEASKAGPGSKEDEKRIRSIKKRAAGSSLKHKSPKKQKVNDQESEDSDKEHRKCLKGDLNTLMKSSEDDEIWRNQQDWKLLSWNLYETCGVHTLMLDDSLVSNNMFVEKRYPLTKEILENMLSSRLEAESESTLALDQIKFIKL
uniref:Uncharacterized protein n=1 Tax=Tanacetum cinerariifolium TaxID=118510 RepID=A0A6L2L9K2_TANCI|nr:hypothetical protein [Tanacetum cinerariifolium]